MQVDTVTFFILSSFALILVLGYFVGRRLNLKKAREVSGVLEKILVPKDQTYVWIGGVVGFRASYVVNGFRQVRVTMLMLPRHSLLYLPVSLITSRSDRLWVEWTFEREVMQKFFIVRGDSKRLLPESELGDGLDMTELRLGKRKFIVCSNTAGYEKFAGVFSGLPENSFLMFRFDGTKRSAGLYVHLKSGTWQDGLTAVGEEIKKAIS
ncbi:MAG: hypothetical protein A2Y33_10165 [Spirochaetes bacterium GWF1_51_8]|nr:MAG: hypothetical protein A2Y33_10165 [Spirochaetes bacterium GWF1_51_8]